MRTVFAIIDTRSNATIINCMEIINATKIWECLNERYGDYFIIRKVAK